MKSRKQCLMLTSPNYHKLPRTRERERPYTSKCKWCFWEIKLASHRQVLCHIMSLCVLNYASRTGFRTAQTGNYVASGVMSSQQLGVGADCFRKRFVGLAATGHKWKWTRSYDTKSSHWKRGQQVSPIFGGSIIRFLGISQLFHLVFPD